MGSIQDETTQTNLSVPPAAASRMKKIFRGAGWFIFGLACLVVFTLIKIPEARLKNFVHGSISAALAPQGITFSAGESHVSIGFGIYYEMKDVTLHLPEPHPVVHIDEVEFTPSLLPMILGKMGGKVRVYNGDGYLKASFSSAGSAAQPLKDLNVTFKAGDLDLGKLGVLPIAAGVAGSLNLVSATGSLSGNPMDPSSLTGSVQAAFSGIRIDQQAIMGFSIPQLGISEGELDATIEKSKANVKNLRLGKAGNAKDDIIANVSGEVLLGKTWNNSNLNIKTRFTFSEKILKAYALLGTLLAAGKQTDGSFAFNLTGPMTSPIPTPVRNP